MIKNNTHTAVTLPMDASDMIRLRNTVRMPALRVSIRMGFSARSARSAMSAWASLVKACSARASIDTNAIAKSTCKDQGGANPGQIMFQMDGHDSFSDKNNAELAILAAVYSKESASWR
jgi:hypothetical protein